MSDNAREHTGRGGSAGAGNGGFMSPLAAAALSFGYAVGWGAFVLPGRVFLPGAGPAGTLIAMLAGAAVMAVLALNFHRLVLRAPGPGGSYGFVTKTFGPDHGFLIAWFLCLTYIAIMWANATALILFVRYLFGDALQFGFHYTLVGFDVYFGEVLLSVAAILACGGICIFRRRLAVGINTVLAVSMVAGVAVCLAAAIWRHEGGFASMAPAFSIDGSPAIQSLRILAMIPWAFVGFEAIVHSSGDFRFRDKLTFRILLSAVAISAFLYAALVVLPVLAHPDKYVAWPAFIYDVPHLAGIDSMPVFASARVAVGRAGVAIIASAMLAGQLTALFCTFIAIGNLMRAMALDGIIPRKFGKLNGDGTPATAIAFAMAISCAVPFLGRTVIGWPVDVSSLGAAVAYCYVSAAAFTVSRNAGGRKEIIGKAAGLFGFVMSVVFCLLMLVPNYLSGNSLSAESYLLLALWCILGFYRYRRVFRKDTQGRFGSSTVVWVAVLVTIFFSSLMWFRLAISNSAENALSNFVGRTISRDGLVWLMEHVDGDMLLNSLVEMCLLVVSLAIMLNLFSLQRDREKSLIIGKLMAEESANKAKSYFFSTISHDIRTPLNALVGFSEMFKAGFRTDAERDHAVDSIMASSQSLLALVNDVLDFSRLEDGSLELSPEPTDCGRLVRETIDSFRVMGKAGGPEFRCRADGLPTLLLDPQRLRQILFNLVENAAKFTEKGFVEVRATFERKGDADAGTFRVEVEDTGCGISAENLKRISSAYEQVGSKISRNGGTGMGLAICRLLAEAMGGELGVESEVGKGSTFTITLRGVKVAEIPGGSAGAQDAGGGVPRPGGNAGDPAGAAPSCRAPLAGSRATRVLLVDDSKMNLMVLKALLKKSGDFEIVTAMDGNEALEALRAPDAAPFDLVLTDMWMPNLDGEGLVKAIRADQRLAPLKVVVVTADVELRGKSEGMGFDGILLKPVTTATLDGVLKGGEG